LADYILEMKVSELKPNPINSTIYSDNQNALKELKESIEQNGLLEPITINKSKLVISGHRRLQALTELGYETCECRMTFFENNTIATIELNRYRVKTESEIVREAEVLKEEYSKYIKRGRPLKGEEKIGKTETITDVSKTLMVSTTKLKKLLSIKNYEPRVKLLRTRVSPNPDSNEFDVIITYEIVGIEAQAQQLSFALQPTR